MHASTHAFIINVYGDEVDTLSDKNRVNRVWMVRMSGQEYLKGELAVFCDFVVWTSTKRQKYLAK